MSQSKKTVMELRAIERKIAHLKEMRRVLIEEQNAAASLAQVSKGPAFVVDAHGGRQLK